VVYSAVYTLYHNSPVVRCLYTTCGLRFVVYSVVSWCVYGIGGRGKQGGGRGLQQLFGSGMPLSLSFEIHVLMEY
jgi:hypothetical protein